MLFKRRNPENYLLLKKVQPLINELKRNTLAELEVKLGHSSIPLKACTDFLNSYLNENLIIFPCDTDVIKFCLTDFKRGIYYYLPVKLSEPDENREKISKLLCKRLAGILRWNVCIKYKKKQLNI